MNKSFWFGTGLGIGFATSFWFFSLPFSYGKKMSGRVIALFEKDNDDVVLKMNNDKHDFVISNGSGINLDVEKLKSKLISQKVDFWVTHPRWPLDMTPYITRLDLKGRTLYSKW